MRLPKILVCAGLLVAFVIGQILVWCDKKMERSDKLSSEALGSEKLA